MSMSGQRNLSFYGRVAPVILALAIIGLLLAPACSSSSGDIADGVKVGQQAPDFALVDLDGNQFNLSDFQGKVVVINFWATWCPPCRAEMPEIESFYQKYKNSDVVVLGIDLLEREERVRDFVQQGGYSWTFAIDTFGEVASAYRIVEIPTTFFLDRQGIIRAVNTGAMTQMDLENRLISAMRE